MGHYVYKYVLNDEVIYIGKSDGKLQERLYQHGRRGDNIQESAWNDINSAEVFYIKLANCTMSDVVESELIRRYKPKYNKAKMSDWCGLQFKEPEWKKFIPEKTEKTGTNKTKKPRESWEDRAIRKTMKEYDNNHDAMCLVCYTIEAILKDEYWTRQYDYNDLFIRKDETYLYIPAPDWIGDNPKIFTVAHSGKCHEVGSFPPCYVKENGNNAILLELTLSHGLKHIKTICGILERNIESHSKIPGYEYDFKPLLDYFNINIARLEDKWKEIEKGVA